jgi:hypothetical protein
LRKAAEQFKTHHKARGFLYTTKITIFIPVEGKNICRESRQLPNKERQGKKPIICQNVCMLWHLKKQVMGMNSTTTGINDLL